MRFVAKCVALGIFILGIVGVIEPDRLITIARFVLTPGGLYAAAALRIVIGLVFILVAPASRTPRLLGIVGVLILIAGLATPVIGLERLQGITEWAAVQDAGLLRGVAVLVAAFGAFLAVATTSADPRPARRRHYRL